MSRRKFLGSTVAFGASALATGAATLNPQPAAAASRLEFKAVPANTLDTITLPDGYGWHVLARWGDGLWSDSPPFDQTTRGTVESQERAIGDNNDGMAIYTHQGRTILAVNNEYVNPKVIYGNREKGLPESLEDVRKGMAGHGISIFEIESHNGQWQVVIDSEFNRRITVTTPMEITGPARGHAAMQTEADPDGTTALGTWSNCGSGPTPWGTYLTCEEGSAMYFTSLDEGFVPDDRQRRYGVNTKTWAYLWPEADPRFDPARHPNEPNRCGYVVEIDPLNPESVPRKRTALGRMAHENAEVVIADDGRVVVYMGDDAQGEFLYRFISEGKFIAGADNRDLLDSGSLYAAMFHDDGSGEWVELIPASTGMPDQAEICIFTREAASAVDATTMDRPEWVAAHPDKAEIYCALTNNKNRGLEPENGGDMTPVNGPNPRAENHYGQIVRWRPDNGDHTADGFEWDLFVLAGNPAVHNDAYAGSDNIHLDNAFNSPDGIGFDSNGILWILTDGKYTNEGDFAGMGNNQVLLADTVTGEIKRFMVGPKEAEITGLCWSPDRNTAFVGIQHPGGQGNGHFPDGGDSVPRSCIIGIYRKDGGPIG